MSSREVDPVGLLAVRAMARYEIGDPSWADAIVAAYLNPEEAWATIRESSARKLSDGA